MFCVLLSLFTDTVTTFGFGESTRVTQHMATGSTNTLWNSDYLAANFDSSLYGSHPFFIQVSDNGKAHGVLFMNSNGMDASLQGDGTDSVEGQSLGVQSTGGVLDFYIFAGPTPQEVVAQYLEVVGMPAMMPYWSLGFHNCRYGYPSVAYVEEVVANYSAANIPLETQWMDIDYMDNYLDFTLDPVLFSQADMDVFLTNLHANNQKFVPIIDPGIYMRHDNYSTLTRGLEQNVFVNDLTGDTPYLGQVWPGPTYYPDWFAVNTTSWWTEELIEFHNMAEYDGLWIDMNEISNFCNVDGRGQGIIISSIVSSIIYCFVINHFACFVF
jgi:alpha-glucosidase (family GH31 glycosyl hydrolase)